MQQTKMSAQSSVSYDTRHSNSYRLLKKFQAAPLTSNVFVPFPWPATERWVLLANGGAQACLQLAQQALQFGVDSLAPFPIFQQQWSIHLAKEQKSCTGHKNQSSLAQCLQVLVQVTPSMYQPYGWCKSDVMCITISQWHGKA